MGEVEGSEKWRRLLPEKLISRGKGTVHRLLAQVQTSLPCDENRERGEEGEESGNFVFRKRPSLPPPPFLHSASPISLLLHTVDNQRGNGYLSRGEFSRERERKGSWEDAKRPQFRLSILPFKRFEAGSLIGLDRSE